MANLVFCIGGPYGHSMDVRSRANETMKLSDMVLNHQVSAWLHTRSVCLRSKQHVPCAVP